MLQSKRKATKLEEQFMKDIAPMITYDDKHIELLNKVKDQLARYPLLEKQLLPKINRLLDIAKHDSDRGLVSTIRPLAFQFIVDTNFLMMQEDIKNRLRVRN